MSNFDDDLDNFDNANNPRPNNNSNWKNNNNGGNNNWKNKNSFKKKEDKDFVLYKPYVVTGNKDAPASVLDDIKELVTKLEKLGFTTRTGGLEGIDQVAEDTSKNIELYLPWNGFNNKQTKLYWNDKASLQAAKIYQAAKAASPVFESLKPAIQAFLAKNARMVLGTKFDSGCLFLLCWSEDGAETKKDVTARTGNVGHVILIANSIGVPIFNLGKEDSKQRLLNYLSLFEQE